MFSAKAFLQKYGLVGISVYGSVTVANIGTLYGILRSGKADALITTPLERILGENAETVQTIKRQLAAQATASNNNNNNNTDNNQQQQGVNWTQEGAYLGIATLVDSLVLPIKLAICLPVARQVLKRRGR